MQTLQELQELRDRLSGLIEAGEVLRAARLVPVFDLSPTQGVRILTDLRMPGAAEAAPVRVAVTGDVGPVPCDAGSLPQFPSPCMDRSESYVREPCTDAPEATALGQDISSPPECAHTAQKPKRRRKKTPEPVSAAKAAQVTGPLSDGERAQIRRLREKGLPPAEIAALLNRRVQTVALFLAAAKKEAAPARPQSATPKAGPNTPGPRQAMAEIPKVLPPAPPPPEPGVPGWQRELRAHLDDLPDRPWPVDGDLKLVEGLARGVILEKLAPSLGVTRGVALDRWRALTGPFMVDGRLPIEWQERLLRELRARVADLCEAAPPARSEAEA